MKPTVLLNSFSERVKTLEVLNKLKIQISAIITYLNIQKQLDSKLSGVGISKDQILNDYRYHHNHFQHLIQKVKDQNVPVTKSFLKAVTFLKDHLDLDMTLRQFSTVKKGALLVDKDSKLEQFTTFSGSALQYKEDITAYPLFQGPNYANTYKHITVVEDPKPQTTKGQLDRLHHLMQLTNAAVLTQLQHEHKTLRAITFGLSYPRFLVNYDEAQLINSAFHRRPNVNDLKQIWNLPEKGAIGTLKYVQFQGIKTNRLIHIPKNKDQRHYSLETPLETSVPVRILYSDQVLLNGESSSGVCGGHQSLPVDTLILHMHGGGFIALSSSTMQSYTRAWANQLNVPVLSIDYCKPPEHRFPQPLQDVEAVYHFVVNRLHLYTNLAPKHIILAGDSAGGNLACALMAKLLLSKQRLPDGIFLAYPAVDLRKVFSPSRLYSFSMPILHPSLLSLCLEEYLGAGKEHQQCNPLASPLLVTEEFIGGKSGDSSFPYNWPPTRIIIGQCDPLYDDSLRLTNRMVAAGIDVHTWVYQNMSHGFLSMDKVLSHGEHGIRKSVSMLRDLLENNKKFKQRLD